MEIEACDVRLGEDCIAKVYQGEELKWSKQNDMRDAYSGLVFTALEDGVEITLDAACDIEVKSLHSDGTWTTDVPYSSYRKTVTYTLNKGEQIGLKASRFSRIRYFSYKNYVKYEGWVWKNGLPYEIVSAFSDNGKKYRADGYLISLNNFNANLSVEEYQEDYKTKVCSCNAFCDAFKGCTGLVSAPLLQSYCLGLDTYGRIFNGCTNLTDVYLYNDTVLFYPDFDFQQSWSGTGDNGYGTVWKTINPSVTKSWLDGVNSEGTIHVKTSVNLLTDSTSGVPNGWNLVVDNQ